LEVNYGRKGKGMVEEVRKDGRRENGWAADLAKEEGGRGKEGKRSGR
jgi:hypothetical protein